jgi:hypothetical protein
MKKMILVKAVAVVLCIGGPAKAGQTVKYWGCDGIEHDIPVATNYRDCVKNGTLILKCSQENADYFCSRRYNAAAPGGNSKK